MRTLTHAVALLAALATLGCSAMVDPGKNDPLKTAEGFCNSIQDALIRLPCGQAPEALDQRYSYFRSACDNLQASVNGGRFAYDSGQAAACIDAIERRGCRGTMNYMAMANFKWPQACQNALRGAVPVGGACTYSVYAYGSQQGTDGYRLGECVEGAGCYTDGISSCGVSCMLPGALGESCMGDRPCAPGLLCAYNFGYTCRSGTTGSPCNYSSDCQQGFYCPGTGSTCQVAPSAPSACSVPDNRCSTSSYCSAGTCIAKAALGQPCGQCQDGLTCYGGSCRNFANEGQSCSATYCNSTPALPLYCDQYLVCRSYPAEPLPRGGDCWGLGTYYCADGLYCDTSGASGPANTCQPQLGAGGDCSSGMGYETCLPGTTCVYDAMAVPPRSTCQPALPLGATCDTSAMYTYCQAGLFCRTTGMTSIGVCDTLPTDREACTPSGMPSYCAPGHYSTWATGPCTCARYKGLGETCTGMDMYECGYSATGLRCMPAAPPAVGNTCQLVNTCEVPIGWLPQSMP